MVKSRYSATAHAPSAMVTEAAEATKVAEAQLDWWSRSSKHALDALRERDVRQVITCARGSSDHAATFAKYLIETLLRIPVLSYSPSTSSIYGTQLRHMERSLLLTISQSGKSSDLLLSAQSGKQAGALVYALVNDKNSPLAQIADFTLPQLAGDETSVAATKTYIASLFSVALLAGHWAHDTRLLKAASSLPGLLEAAWAKDWSDGARLIDQAENIYILGRGSTFAIAQEAALKLKETSGIHAEAFSAAEVRHGPMELVGEGFPVMMFVPDDEAAQGFSELASEFAARGATVIVAGARYAGATKLPTVDTDHPALSAICMIQSFYKMAAQVSTARGHHPDKPTYLHKVTDTL